MNNKKIFFVHPHSQIKNGIVNELINLDYEVYLLDSFKDIDHVCRTYSNPYIYINIDEGLDQFGWQVLINEIMSDPELNHANLGVITYNKDEELAKNYLLNIMVPCGFLVLKQGHLDGTEQIVRTLEANEVNKKRRNVRTTCQNREATFNLNYKGTKHFGEILELSSVGMTVRFDKDISITKFANLTSIQLKLKGTLLLLSAAMIGLRVRSDGSTIFVFIFRQNCLESSKAKIRQYINKKIQAEFQERLAQRKCDFQYNRIYQTSPICFNHFDFPEKSEQYRMRA